MRRGASLHSLHMKRLLATFVLLPLLAGCSTASILYDIQLNTEDEERGSMLLTASLRVIERRMASIGEEVLDLDIKKEGEGHRVYLKVKEQAALDALTEDLTSPFSLKVMKEAPPEEADAVVEGHGGFSETGITEKHLKWLQASEEPGGKGRVTITFSEEGRTLMGEVFRQNKGKSIGLFVRGNLVSKLFVDTDELKDEIIITDIPSVQLANVFADDVNVGMHVTFTPVP